MSQNQESAFASGVIFAFFVFMFFWHMIESQCQFEHDVADCEFTFVPVIVEKPNDR